MPNYREDNCTTLCFTQENHIRAAAPHNKGTTIQHKCYAEPVGLQVISYTNFTGLIKAKRIITRQHKTVMS